MSIRNVNTDPIGYCLDSLWAHATESGRWDATAALRALVAEHQYAEAMMLAIAIELDRAKRSESRKFWTETHPKLEASGVDMALVLDELGKRELFAFLAEHMNDFRELRGKGTPPPPPNMSDLGSILPPPPPSKPCPPAPPMKS